jgi:cyclomaltodextrinase
MLRKSTFTRIFAVIMVFYTVLAMTEVQVAQAVAEKELQQRNVVVVGNLQHQLGAAKDWDPSDMKTKMTDLGNGFYSYTANLPAGAYFYKIAINGSWTENYGLNGNFDGANVQLNLLKSQQITFYYNDVTHKITDSSSYKMLNDNELPKITGNLTKAAKGEFIMRDTMLDEFYMTSLDVKAGTYKIIIDQKNNNPVTQEVIFTKDDKANFYFDPNEKKLIVDDGSIHEDKIYHNTWDIDCRKPFEAIKTGSEVTLSIRGQKGDIKNAQLILLKSKITDGGGDEYNIDYNAGIKTVYDMSFSGTKGDDDVWTKTIKINENGVYGYKFLLNGIKEYGEDAKPGQTGMVTLRGGKPFQLTVYSADYKTPDWTKEAVIYQIFPDRFFNGDKSNDNAKSLARGKQPVQHRSWDQLPANASKTPAADGDAYECNDFFGGDLAGITQKLDYLKDLGVTAIYINPIMEASSNHRYDTVNYERIDPFLGTQADFDKLIQEMNKRGMQLIMDGVFNHVGDDSIYVDRYGKYEWVGAYEYWSRVYDLMNKKHMSMTKAEAAAKVSLIAEGQKFSPYNWQNWFDIRNEITKDDMGTKYAYHDWQGYTSLVPFKNAPPTAVSPVKNAPNQLNNIDLDNYLIYDDNAILTKWLKKGLSGWRLDVAKEVSPEFWEAVRKQVKSLKTLQGQEPLLLGEIWQDGSQFLTGDQFDSVMNYKLSFAVGDLFLNKGDAAAADVELKVLMQNYPKEALYALMNIVDSHDTVRAIYKLGGGKESVAQATLKDFNYEQGKERLKLAAAFLMGYPGAPTIYYGDEAGVYGSADPDCRKTYPWGNEDQELLAYYKKVIKVRNDNKKLFAYGDVFTLKAEGDIYVYGRSWGDEDAVVAMNRGDAMEITLDVPQFVDDTVFTDALDDNYTARVQNGKLTINLEKSKARMMVNK